MGINSLNKLVLILTLLSVFSFVETVHAQLISPQLVSPPDGASDQPVSVSLEWNEVLAADEYRVQVATDEEFSDPETDLIITDTSLFVEDLAHETTYYWRVRSRNLIGVISDWSEVWNFTTEDDPADPPPITVPVLASPSDGVTGVSTDPTLEWEAAEEADSYTVQVATDEAFDSLVADEAGITGTEFQLSGLDHETTYYWRVMASNDGGNSDWSQVWSFTTETEPVEPPAAPMLASPGNGATGVPTDPTLEWNPVDDADSYRVQLSTDVDFSSIEIDSITSNTTIVINELNNETTYHWRVLATNDGGESDWSDAWSFTTEAEPVEPPSAPVLASPENGAIGTATSPTLSWEAAERADTYRVQLAGDEAFETLIADQDAITETEFQIDGLDHETTYYWHVLAANEAGESEWSQVWSFTTETEPAEPPAAPILASPDDGATGVPTDPTLEWNPVDDADSYTLQVATNEQFSEPIVDESGLSSTSFEVTGLDYETTYHWRVSASNEGGESDWSETRSFTTEEEPIEPPATPVLASPEDGAADVSTSPTLAWEAAEEADSYTVQVADNDDFDNPVIDQTTVSTELSVEGLDYETTYHWRIQASNEAGNSEWSGAWSFTTREEPLAAPGAPGLVSPGDGATGQPTTLTFEWEEVLLADSYHLQVAAGGDFNDPAVDREGLDGTSEEVAGLDYETTYSWRVRAANAAGQSDWSDAWSFVTESGRPPIAVIHPSFGIIWRSNETRTIEWETANDNIDSIHISYSTNNGDTWSTIAEGVIASNRIYNWQIPDTSSMNARIKIEDAGNEQMVAVSDPFIIYRSTTHLAVSYSFDPKPASPDYRLVGLPAQTNIPASQLFDGIQGTDWNIYFDNGAPSDYLIEYDDSELFNFQPGKAFWAISRNPVEFTGEAETVHLSEDSTFAVSLHSGWNIISNPFDLPVSWNAVQSLNDLTETIWSFEGSFEQSARLEPYRGYYFYNGDDLDELHIPYTIDESPSMEKQIAGNDELISISVYEDEVRHTSIQLGFNPAKVRQHDRVRQKAPPGDFLDFYLTIIDTEEKTGNRHDLYATEIRGEVGQKQIYDLRLNASEETAIQFKIDGIKSAGVNEIYLISKRTGKVYDLHELSPAWVTPEYGVNKYTLLIGSSQAAEETRRQITPEAFILSRNYPNPFNNQTVIEYGIPESASNEQVVLEVFDIQGRRVSTLVNEQQRAGFYEINWNAASLASGVYFYRIRAGSFMKTRKMTLIQ